MALTRKKDGTLEISKCMGFCQKKDNDSRCGKGCRNNSETIIDGDNIEDFNNKIEYTKEYYYKQLDDILKYIN